MPALAQATIEQLPLADNSVDLVFTDPPYAKEFLPCYKWLAIEAARVLRDGGFLIALCGGAYLNQIFRHFDNAKLSYYWLYSMEMIGQTTGIVWPNGSHSVNISTRVKHYAAYSKGIGLSRTCTVGKFVDSGTDKRYHEWGQNISSARYYIDCFSHEGDLVCDPFIGGGTTAIACMALHRRFVGFDIDMQAVKVSRDRLAGKKKENLHELPLFRKSAPAPFTRLVFDATDGKAELKTETI